MRADEAVGANLARQPLRDSAERLDEFEILPSSCPRLRRAGTTPFRLAQDEGYLPTRMT
jgi:hypothetical protein